MNPCGRAVDWIQFPFEVNTKVHDGPGAPVVRLRWMFTSQPFLPVGTGCVINNREWSEDKESDLTVGQLPLVESEYKQDARWRLPALAFSGHMCHPEWLATGEPWPVPSTLPPTVYLDGWIPECCVVCCEFVGCSLDPVNDAPASQWRQYAIAAKDATADTPFVQSEVGDAVGGSGPNVRGAVRSYRPLGASGQAGWTERVLADAAGTMLRMEREVVVDEENVVVEVMQPSGYTLTLVVGGTTTALTLAIVAGVGELCGNNLRICAALMPDGVTPRATAGYVAAGTTQAGATPITTTGAQVVSLNTAHGVRAPTSALAGNRVLTIVHMDTSPVVSCLLYPASGQAFAGSALNTPITLARGTGVMLLERGGRNGEWAVVPY